MAYRRGPCTSLAAGESVVIYSDGISEALLADLRRHVANCEQ